MPGVATGRAASRNEFDWETFTQHWEESVRAYVQAEEKFSSNSERIFAAALNL